LKTLGAIFAAFVLILLLVACQAGDGSGSAALKTGDCYSLGSGQDANGDNVQTYNLVDCTTTHDGEIFSVFDYPNAAGWPGYEAIGTVQQTRCEADFQTYVGVSFEQSKYTINYVAPTEQSWASGDHAIKCRLEDASNGKITGSAKGTKK
jgi:hypothetical protein